MTSAGNSPKAMSLKAQIFVGVDTVYERTSNTSNKVTSDHHSAACMMAILSNEAHFPARGEPPCWTAARDTLHIPEQVFSLRSSSSIWRSTVDAASLQEMSDGTLTLHIDRLRCSLSV